MGRSFRSQRGEGKLGCVITFAVVASIVAVGLRVIPVLFKNSEYEEYADQQAQQAVRLEPELMRETLVYKAKELGINLGSDTYNAVRVSRTRVMESGECRINIEYMSKVDLYGIYEYEWQTKIKITRPVLYSI